MFAWCAGAGMTGWLVMLAFWGVFLALALWSITRLIPSTPPASRSEHRRSDHNLHATPSDDLDDRVPRPCPRPRTPSGRDSDE